MSVFGSHYPPGCTDRDIDEHFGSEEYQCDRCGKRLPEDELDDEASANWEAICKACAAEMRAEEDEQ